MEGDIVKSWSIHNERYDYYLLKDYKFEYIGFFKSNNKFYHFKWGSVYSYVSGKEEVSKSIAHEIKLHLSGNII